MADRGDGKNNFFSGGYQVRGIQPKMCATGTGRCPLHIQTLPFETAKLKNLGIKMFLPSEC